MDVVCGWVVAAKECWCWLGGSGLPQFRRLRRNEVSHKPQPLWAEILIDGVLSFRGQAVARIC